MLMNWCWRYTWKYMWMGCDIFGLRIVIINECCWNWNVFIVMEVLVK
jgi:hypothetical protein